MLPKKITVFLSRKNLPSPQRKRNWVLFLLICVCSLLVWGSYLVASWRSESSFVVTGMVTHEDAALANVYVTVGGREALTEVDGGYVLRINRFGYTQLVFEKDQYERSTKRIFVWKKTTTVPPVSLQKSSAFTGIFEGIVTDSFEKRPIVGAQVKISGRTAITDDNGRFILRDLNTGERSVQIAAEGYEDLRQDIKVANEAAPYAFEVTPYGKLVFTNTTEGHREIMTTSLDGRQIHSVTGGLDQEAWGGVMTPNGSGVLFFSYFGPEDEGAVKKTGLFYAQTDSDQAVRISRDLVVDSQIEVTPDSKYVIFAAKEFPDSIPELYMVELKKNGVFRQLTHNQVYETQFRIAPDAHTVIYSAYAEGSRDLFRIDVNTYDETRLTASPGYEQGSVFSHDGRYLYFVRQDNDTGSVLVELELATETPRILYQTISEIGALTLSPESDRIAFVITRGASPVLMIRQIKGDLRPVEIMPLPSAIDGLMWMRGGRSIITVGPQDDAHEVAVVWISERKREKLFAAERYPVTYLAR